MAHNSLLSRLIYYRMAQRTTEYVFTDFQAEIAALIIRYCSSILHEKYNALKRNYEGIQIEHVQVCNNFFGHIYAHRVSLMTSAIYATAHKITGVTNYVIACMLPTRSMAPSLIYKVSFSLRTILQISVCQN